MGVFRRATICVIMYHRRAAGSSLLLSQALWDVALEEWHDGGVPAQKPIVVARVGASCRARELLVCLGLRANPFSLTDFMLHAMI